MGSDYLMGNEVFFWGDEKVFKLESWWLHNPMNACTKHQDELYTLKWLIVCYYKFQHNKNFKRIINKGFA